ncbi:MAG: amino acid adenylation domain-containing protein [Micromonosporaceae bacterium]
MSARTPSFAHLLWERAQAAPDQTAYTYLSEPRGSLTYGTLHRRAAALAARLRATAPAGERAVLLVPPGLDYTVAFFGCLYAGLIAVPAYPPLDERQLPRLVSVLKNARPRLVLTLADLTSSTRESLLRHRVSADIEIVATDAEDGPPALSGPPAVGRDDIAFLQYTSGSASDPKGVMVTHANLFDNSAAICTLFGHDADSVGVIWLPPYHDMGLIGGILQPLYGGFPVVLMSPLDFLAEPALWLQAISEHRATTSGGPNFSFDLCVRKTTEEQRAGLDLSSWSLAFCGAEPVRAQTLERFATAFAPYGFRREALYPCYGLAECTLIAAGGHKGSGVNTRDGVVSCGSVIEGHRLTVRKPGGSEEVFDGQIGEVCLSGPSVSPGYWDAPEAGAEAFAADLDSAHAARPGHTLRTGDLGFLHEGQLFVTGRLKDIIIVRGRNLAAEDVEFAVTGCHPLIRPGCVAAFGVTGAGGEELAVLAELRQEADGAALQEASAAVQAALAAQFGVTADRVLLARRGTVLKTPSGKIRRNECRNAYLAGTFDLLAGAPPGREDAVADDGANGWADIAARLAKLAAAVLDRPAGSIRTDQGLTALGMDSLRAVELRHAARTELALDLPLQALLGGASPAALAREAAAATAGGSGGGEEGVEPQTNEIVTDGERALWLTSRLSADPAHYVLTIALNLRDPVDPDAAQRSLRLLSARHPALRTYFPDVAGQPRRRPWDRPIVLRIVDVADDTAADRWISDFADEGLNPSNGAPWKAALLRLASGGDILVLCAHHMACDLWSLDILAHEFVDSYRLARRGLQPDWAPAGDPARIASRLEAGLSGEYGRLLEDFWRAELRDGPPSGRLPQARRAHRGIAPAGRHQFVIPGTLAACVRELASATGVTPYTVLLTGFAWLLHHYSGERRFIVGVPAPGRLDPDSASAVGYFVNPLPFVCEINPGDTFASHLHRFRDKLAAALAHQDYPYQRILETCGRRRGEQMIQVLMLHQQAPNGDALPLLAGDPHGAEDKEAFFTPRLVAQRNAPFELTIEIADSAGAFSCACTYDTEKLSEPDVAAAAGHWLRLIEQLMDAPQTKPPAVHVLRDRERRQLLHEWNAPAVAVDGPPTLHEAILRAAQRFGSAVAVRDEDGELTYAELAGRSQRMAAALARRGAGPGRPVGLLMPRSTGLIVAILAALRTGAPYVPLDPDHPEARLTLIAADCRPAVIVTHRGAHGAREALGGVPLLPQEKMEDPVSAPPPAPSHPDWPAYVMYTSGSTGVPKGVVCGHRGVLNLLADPRLRVASGPGNRYGWWTSPGFDVSVYEIFRALTTGAAVEVCPPGARNDTCSFMEWAAQRGVTSAYMPPHLLPEFPAWLEHGQERSSLRHIMVSVEPIPEPLVTAIMRYAPGLVVTNGYGPTEATIFSTLYTAERASTEKGIIPMGRGVINCPHYLLDEQLRLVPPGAPGEVYIGGAGLAHGYNRRGGATAERFIPSPFAAGERLYRTGDLACYRPDGQIVFLGRSDHQVKVRGMRIEPREVEAVMAAHTEVSTALVLAEDTGQGQRLAGYALVAAGRAHDRALAADIAAHVRERLPSPMVPRHVLLVDKWPMTINGKIDRSRLPRPDTSDRDYEPPEGEDEAVVAEVWAQLLDEGPVGRNDDFFELGGDSLLAARAASRLAERLRVQVDAVDIMDRPVVCQLAAELAMRVPAPPPDDERALRALLDHVAGLPAEVCERIVSQPKGGV